MIDSNACTGSDIVKGYFKLLFNMLLVIFMFWLIYRKIKRFSPIFQLDGLDFPIKRFYVGIAIHVILIMFFIIELISIFYFNNNFKSEIYLIPLGLVIIYLFLGSVPDIMENKHKVKVNVDFSGRRSGGFDFFGSWVGQYENGIIIYHYLIEKNTIKVLKKTDEEIVFNGITETKKGRLPIEVKLRSKPSIEYFKEIL